MQIRNVIFIKKNNNPLGVIRIPLTRALCFGHDGAVTPEPKTQISLGEKEYLHKKK